MSGRCHGGCPRRARTTRATDFVLVTQARRRHLRPGVQHCRLPPSCLVRRLTGPHRSRRLRPRRRPVAEPWNVRPSRGSSGEGESPSRSWMSQAVSEHRVAGGREVSRGGLSMTTNGRFKKAVRRHAEHTGQRYTEALTDLEGLRARMHHTPDAERLLAHLRDHHGIDAIAATKLSVHKTYVFRVDRKDGAPWVARAFPPARPRAGVEGDAAILRFLARQGYPAERLAADDAVSDFDGSAVLVT